MTRKPDITVIFSTFNRRDYLRQTLEAMCEVDREGLNVEFVIVDNNSVDDTRQVIGQFVDRLPLRHLFESRPGKNCALNHALNAVELGEIVVFTDDDVVPRGDWLRQIAAACIRWPEYDVFGGKIELIWPYGVAIPRWATENVDIRGIGFTEHDLGTEDRPYQPDSVPSGPNYWMRGRVLNGNTRFDESVWTRPGRGFCMGDETELLLRLAMEGRQMLYTPRSVIGHHVQVSLLSPKNMLRRAIRYGRGGPHVRGIPDPQKLAKHPWRWRIRRLLAMGWHASLFIRALLNRDECRRMKNAVETLAEYAYHREALAMSWRSS